MLASRTSRLQAMIDHYLRITIQDERTFVGKMIAFDRHLNLVLSDCEEFRKIKPKGGGAAGMQEYEEKRTLGLIVIRGETILSLKVESGLQYSSDKLNIMGSSGGIGFARAAGRGISTGTSGAPPMGAASLTGPVKGVGAPSPVMLNPQIDRGAPQNQAAGRGQMPIGIPPMMPPRPGMPILPPIGMPIPGMPPPRPGMPIAGMPPPGSFGRGMPMIPQQGFPPLQPGQMPPNARPGMVPMPPPMNMMGMPPNQMGYPPPMPPPPPQQHQNFRPPQQ